MFAAAVLGVMAMVSGVLLAALGQFPGQTQEAPVDDPQGSAQQVGEKINSVYTAVIQDLITFIDNPDLGRAERQQTAMATFAEGLALQFRGLSDSMKQELDRTQAEAAQLAATPTPTPTP